MNGDFLKRLVPGAALVGAALGSYAGIRALAEVPAWVQALIMQQGSDFMVAVAFIGGAFYFGPKFVRSQQDQAVALSSLAESVKILPQKDAMKFEEILILQDMQERQLTRLAHNQELMRHDMEHIVEIIGARRKEPASEDE